MNHTSDQHPWFQAARADRDSPYRDFYVWRDEKPEEKPGDVVFPDQENSNWAYDEQAGQYYLHRFYSHQPDLNVANPAVRDEIAQVMGFWLEQGLSGFRVDAVPFLLEPMGMPEGALDDPHELLRDLRAYISRRNGDAMLLGEVNLKPPEVREFFGDEDGDELHMLLRLHRHAGACTWRSRAATRRRCATALRESPADPDRLPVGALRAQPRRAHARQALRGRARGGLRRASGPTSRCSSTGAGCAGGCRRCSTATSSAIRMVYSLAFSLPGHAGAVLRRGDRDGREPRDRGPPERALADAVVRRAARRVLHRGRRGRAVPADRSRTSASGPPPSTSPRQRRDAGLAAELVRAADPAPARVPGARLRHARRCSTTGAPSVLAHRCDWDGATIVAVHELGGEAVTVTVALDRPDDADALVDLFSARRAPARRRARRARARAARVSLAARPARGAAATALNRRRAAARRPPRPARVWRAPAAGPAPPGGAPAARRER